MMQQIPEEHSILRFRQSQDLNFGCLRIRETFYFTNQKVEFQCCVHWNFGQLEIFYDLC